MNDNTTNQLQKKEYANLLLNLDTSWFDEPEWVSLRRSTKKRQDFFKKVKYNPSQLTKSSPMFIAQYTTTTSTTTPAGE